MEEFWKFTLTAVLATAALTACGSQETPAADPAPTTRIVAQIPAPPQVTIAPPSNAGGYSESAEAPTVTSATAADPASNTAPITPVDPAMYAAPNDQVGWKSPSGNIFCKLGSTAFSSGCQATDAPIPDSADCDKPPFSADELSKGFFLDPGQVTPMCFNQGAFGVQDARSLDYNTSISFGEYTCYSRVEAMICDAGSGHGFVLSMQQATWN